MSSIYLELDERLSVELEQHYFSSDDKERKIDRQEKFRVMNALHRLWNFDELACYGVVFRTEDIRKVILDLMKPEHIRLALKSVEFSSRCRDSVWWGVQSLCSQDFMRICKVKSEKEFSAAGICLWWLPPFFPR